jgi:vesicle-fusing ATPase
VLSIGIGGLDEEFNTMFRRVFASRVLPLDVIEKMGIKHVKGILMHGPPGTGKTLMARQIGKMLNSREPKIVNGPEILNKYVGESEGNIRKLFEDAEKEEKDKGKHSQLHIIIFDEIDSICKSRGSNGTGVGDSIVNQLLSKIDGINSLNNVLIIGMTNRMELLDEALTRPGRLELKIEIGLPNEAGRKQIFDIHLGKLKENKMLGTDVNVDVLAMITKNYTGAEIEGLIRAASSYSYNRCINSDTFTADKEKLKQVQVTFDDFKLALNEIQPSFGTSNEDISQYYMNSIMEWGKYRKFIENVVSQIDKFRKNGKLLSILLNGIPKDGKTTMAVNLARCTEFPFIKFISPENMIGMSEQRKIEYINSAFQNAYKSKYSVIVIDDIDIMIDYNEVGDKYSNAIVQVLKSLIKKTPKNDNKLLILGTITGRYKHVLINMICNVFTDVIQVPLLRNGDDVREIGFDNIGDMDFSERDYGIKEALHAIN